VSWTPALRTAATGHVAPCSFPFRSFPMTTTQTRYPVTIKYNKTLQQMIRVGNYRYVSEHIIEQNFPIDGSGTVSLELITFYFRRPISSKAAVCAMKRAGYRPSILPELLALGRKYPELQRRFSIIALGSPWVSPYGDRRVPSLDIYEGNRTLSLA